MAKTRRRRAANPTTSQNIRLVSSNKLKITGLVTSLAPTTIRDKLISHFEVYGKLQEAQVPNKMGSKGKKNRGHGFVVYYEAANCEKALASGPHIIDGTTVTVSRFSKTKGMKFQKMKMELQNAKDTAQLSSPVHDDSLDDDSLEELDGSSHNDGPNYLDDVHHNYDPNENDTNELHGDPNLQRYPKYALDQHDGDLYNQIGDPNLSDPHKNEYGSKRKYKTSDFGFDNPGTSSEETSKITKYNEDMRIAPSHRNEIKKDLIHLEEAEMTDNNDDNYDERQTKSNYFDHRELGYKGMGSYEQADSQTYSRQEHAGGMSYRVDRQREHSQRDHREGDMIYSANKQRDLDHRGHRQQHFHQRDDRQRNLDYREDRQKNYSKRELDNWDDRNRELNYIEEKKRQLLQREMELNEREREINQRAHSYRGGRYGEPRSERYLEMERRPRY